MRLVVLCPHFAPDTAPTGRVMTRIVEELAARGHRVDVVTALPWYRHHRVEPGWHDHRGPPEVHGVGVDHAGQSVPGRRQAQPGPPGDRLCRVLGAGPRRGPRRRRMAAPCRRRHRHVATADDGCHRPARRLGPPLPARVQHPRRVPGRRRGDRGGHQPGPRRRSVVAGADQLSDRRRRHGAVRRPRRQRRRQTPRRSAVQGADDPELRRHRPRSARAGG